MDEREVTEEGNWHNDTQEEVSGAEGDGGVAVESSSGLCQKVGRRFWYKDIGISECLKFRHSPRERH
ncbi:hypothetical protein R1flu_018328 [Riccia fluitans]|uniref:Uncharacterized protein n=1 Tax=Riccia fluitans TaxID=41844 RepID=A0ABD1ZFT7_9MARC